MSHLEEQRLWSGDAPLALGNEAADIPTITFHPPEPARASGAAMLILPGGGYGRLAQHEGAGYGVWLAAHGIAAFVLKYRTGSRGYRHPAMQLDAARALRLLRAGAADWQIDPQRIGIMGSSAGGHLASILLTAFDSGDASAADPVDRQSCRPDLGVLCYPVISMGPDGHGGSRQNLLGDNPPPELLEQLSSERQVRPDTPLCFLWHTLADTVVKAENSVSFAMALRKCGVAFELHIYQAGHHGLGLGRHDIDPHRLHPWTDDLLHWLRLQKWIG